VILWVLGLILGVASGGEFRTVELADGRLVTAELLGLEHEVMEAQLPQGRVSWPLSTIRSMEPSTAEAYRTQPAWTVLVLPVGYASDDLIAEARDAAGRLVGLLPRVPALDVWERESLDQRLDPAEREALLDCGPEPLCALALLGPRAPHLVIGAELVPGDGVETPVLRMTSGYAGSPLAARQVRVPYPIADPGLDAQVMAGLYPLFHLEPDRFLLAELATYTVPGAPTPAPPPVASVPSWRLVDSELIGWVPLPGLPHLVAGDARGAAVAWAVVVPGTAAMVYVAGWSTWKRRQLWVAGLGSYAVLSVAVNQLLLAGDTPRAARLGVVPLEGGAAVTATVAVP